MEAEREAEREAPARPQDQTAAAPAAVPAEAAADQGLVRLHDLQQFLSSGSLEDNLDGQATQTARMLGADSCSIMLLSSGSGEAPRLRVHARANLAQGKDAPEAVPDAVFASSIGRGEGICGQVLASGRALLVEDIGSSPYALLARRPLAPGRSLMSGPIPIDGRIVGVVNVSGMSFRQADLLLLEVICQFIGKTIQVSQLQRLLDSRFAQLALAREAEAEGAARTVYRNPEEAARILARSFYRELTRAGFDVPQIVRAASELIGQLNNKLHQEK
ncbi:GAF domain-containing protein [Massilia sp. Dwa41.01b]|uniref:GAF domain-containing protein n=1 Tax=unclassified Massilia TaxID=2609279 RepID=UPI0015FF4D7E|nr:MULTISPECIES: GAF domain-containing protein [unclassified Massilia]QNA90810.1 GAF domain-containing protein [Massilia sp. Dwa41.01b]QNA98048.1 GAF domain-containing protein [Massilia sp. Se16.2.3]